MICVVQRVSSASVRVEGSTIGAIGVGLLALVGVVPEDDDADVAYIAERLSTLRIFADGADAEGRMNLSVQDADGALLLVPQFTLAADTRRGRRPSFSGAAPPEQGKRLFDALVAYLEGGPVPVRTGEFGAIMEVDLVNDGPVTFILDSAHPRRPGRGGAA
jgi:D-tyrosyl-tRNA(Tyr) deacylase